MTNIILGSVPESIQNIVGTQGIFHIRWKKKDNRKYIIKKYSDGSESQIWNPDYGKHKILRVGNFRLGVTKNTKGGKRTTNPNEYLIAYDMTKKEFRNIFYNSIQKIVANKKTYFVKVVDTKNFRFGLIERVTNDKG
jgi:hypothetical protein